MDVERMRERLMDWLRKADKEQLNRIMKAFDEVIVEAELAAELLQLKKRVNDTLRQKAAEADQV